MKLPREYSCQKLRLGNRYLQACYYNYKTTYQMIVLNCDFIDSNFPIDQRGVQDLLDTGVIYITGRAKIGYYPVLVINCTKLVD